MEARLELDIAESFTVTGKHDYKIKAEMQKLAFCSSLQIPKTTTMASTLRNQTLMIGKTGSSVVSFQVGALLCFGDCTNVSNGCELGRGCSVSCMQK